MYCESLLDDGNRVCAWHSSNCLTNTDDDLCLEFYIDIYCKGIVRSVTIC